MQIRYYFTACMLAALTPSAAFAETHSAAATLEPKSGSAVSGDIKITQQGKSAVLDGTITGLTPGKHGFHVHEKGDCSSADAKSAGDHFNPTGSPHAGPHDAQRHAGDLGNLEADKNGVAKIKLTDEMISLSGPHSIVGRALVVHKSPDDLKTQPSGDSGDRIACAVIKAE